MLKVQDLRNKSEKELLAMISELKGKLLALRFENATGQLAEIHLIKDTKRDIARVFTVIKEKQSGIVVESKEIATSTTKKVEAPKAVEAKDENVVDVEGTEETDLSKMTVAALKELATSKGVEFKSTVKKDELIKLIEEAK